MSSEVYPGAVRGLTYGVVKAPGTGTIKQAATSGYSVRVGQYQNPMWKWTLLYEYLKNDTPNPTLPLGPNYTDYQQWIGFFLARGGQLDDFLFTDISDLNGGPPQTPNTCYVGPALLQTLWTPLTKVGIGFGVLDPSNHWQQVTIAGTTGRFMPTWNDSGGATSEAGSSVVWQDKGLMPLAGFPNLQAQLQLVTDGTNWYSPIQRSWGGLFYEDITDLNGAIEVYQNGGSALVPSIAGPGLALPGQSFGGLYIPWLTEPPTPLTAQFKFYYRVAFDMDDTEMEQFMQFVWTIGGNETSRNGSGTVKLITSRPNLL
jgi:hypothetical protein